MGKPEKMRNMLRILKDKVSILKATLSLSSKPTKSFHLAILRATTLHHPLDPPPVDAVLSLTQQNHRISAGVLLHALLQRLHATHSAYVALKCLITLHYVITHGSPSLREQIGAYSSGPLFNLSNFMDESDDDTCQLSYWVRWYADVLDYSLSRTRVNTEKRFLSFVIMVEKICGAPDSLHYQKLSLIFEVMKLVGEDYRIIMREINTKLNNLSRQRIEELSSEKLGNLLNDLKRVEKCKEKLLEMFLNKKRNDGIWELIEQVMKDVEEIKEKRENMKMVKFEGTESKLVAVVGGTRVKRWLDVEWNTLLVSSA